MRFSKVEILGSSAISLVYSIALSLVNLFFGRPLLVKRNLISCSIILVLHFISGSARRFGRQSGNVTFTLFQAVTTELVNEGRTLYPFSFFFFISYRFY